MLIEALKTATEDGMSINMVLGLDKKNTSKEMLLKLLNLGISSFLLAVALPELIFFLRKNRICIFDIRRRSLLL